eukprot:1730897-Rhodomonas_salina.1
MVAWEHSARREHRTSSRGAGQRTGAREARVEASVTSTRSPLSASCAARSQRVSALPAHMAHAVVSVKSTACSHSPHCCTLKPHGCLHKWQRCTHKR